MNAITAKDTLFGVRVGISKPKAHLNGSWLLRIIGTYDKRIPIDLIFHFAKIIHTALTVGLKQIPMDLEFFLKNPVGSEGWLLMDSILYCLKVFIFRISKTKQAEKIKTEALIIKDRTNS